MRIRNVPPRSGCLAFAEGGSPSAKLSRGRNPNVPAAVAAAPNLSKSRREIGCGVGRDSITESLLRPRLARAGLGLAVLHSAWRFCECRRSQAITGVAHHCMATNGMATNGAAFWSSAISRMRMLIPDTGRAVVIRIIARCASQMPNVNFSARVLGDVMAAAGCGGGRPAASRGSSAGGRLTRWRARTVACF